MQEMLDLYNHIISTSFCNVKDMTDLVKNVNPILYSFFGGINYK